MASTNFLFCFEVWIMENYPRGESKYGAGKQGALNDYSTNAVLQFHHMKQLAMTGYELTFTAQTQTLWR